MNKIDAPQISGGHEAREISHHTAAQGDDKRAALELVVCQLVVACLYIFQRLRFFASRLGYENGLEGGCLQGGKCRVAIKLGNCVIRDDSAPLTQAKAGTVFAEFHEQACPNPYRVRAFCQRYLDRTHGEMGLGRSLLDDVGRDCLHAQVAGFITQLKLDLLADGAAADSLAHGGEIAEEVIPWIAVPCSE